MLISIIVPCYNVNDFITECLDSVYKQTYPNIEVICVDNNSTDNTLETINKLKEKYIDLVVLSETKPGAPAARNKGLSIAKGEWIQFLDADDLLLPNKIKHQVEIINNQLNFPFIASSYYHCNLKKDLKIKTVECDIWKALFASKLGITSANLFKKEVLDKIGGWNDKLNSSQEYDLMFRVLKNYSKPLIDDMPLTIVQERQIGQITQRNPSEKWYQYIILRLEILEYLKNSKNEYYLTNKSWFDNELFVFLKLYSVYNLTSASLIFNQTLGKNFYPELHNVKSTIYKILYKCIGFKWTQFIVNKLK